MDYKFSEQPGLRRISVPDQSWYYLLHIYPPVARQRQTLTIG